MIHTLRTQLTRYLNQNFPLVTSTHLTPFIEINTPLFTILNENNKNHLWFNKKDFPSLYLFNFIHQIEHQFKNETNQIPIRWYHILKEFYIPDLKFNVVKTMDYTSKVNKLNDLTITNMIKEATNIEKYSIVVSDDKWNTTQYSKLVKIFFENSKKYKSLNGYYDYLPAVEGGIEFHNSYVDDFVLLNHSQFNKGSIRNEVKGTYQYNTNKDITPEELMVLHLIMKKENIENKFFN